MCRFYWLLRAYCAKIERFIQPSALKGLFMKQQSIILLLVLLVSGQAYAMDGAAAASIPPSCPRLAIINKSPFVGGSHKAVAIGDRGGILAIHTMNCAHNRTINRYVLHQTGKQIYHIRASNDSSRLYLCRHDGTFDIVDTQTGHIIKSTQLGSRELYDIALDEQNNMMLVGGEDGVLHMLDLQGNKLSECDNNRWVIESLALSVATKQAMVGLSNTCSYASAGAVVLFDCRQQTVQALPHAHSDWVTSVALSADGKKGFSAGYGFQMSQWDFSGKPTFQKVRNVTLCPSIVKLALAGDALCTTEDSGEMKIYDIRDFSVKFKHRKEGQDRMETGTFSSLTISDDAKVAAAALSDRKEPWLVDIR